MRISKKIIIITIIICIVSFIISICFELLNLGAEIEEKYHFAYLINVFMGIFASSLLVLVPTLVQFHIEKSNYYQEMYKNSSDLLYSAMEIINRMEKYSQDDGEVSSLFDRFNQAYNVLVSRFTTHAYFFVYSQEDKLLESIINESTRFIILHRELLKYSKQLKNQMLSEEEYKKCFDLFRQEMLTTYKDRFTLYKEKVEENMRRLIKDRELKTYDIE